MYVIYKTIWSRPWVWGSRPSFARKRPNREVGLIYTSSFGPCSSDTGRKCKLRHKWPWKLIVSAQAGWAYQTFRRRGVWVSWYLNVLVLLPDLSRGFLPRSIGFILRRPYSARIPPLLMYSAWGSWMLCAARPEEVGLELRLSRFWSALPLDPLGL